MSFGPGDGRGVGPPNPNAGFIPPTMGGMMGMPSAMHPMPMPPVPGMPMFPPMMPPAPLPYTAQYPQGQGPLAGRPASVGANGLLAAPKEEGPEEHGT